MNWAAVLVGMLPEHILLGAIVLLIAIETMSSRRWDALPLSLLTLSCAVAASAALYFGGFDVVPFPGQLAVDPAAVLSKMLVLVLAIPVVLIARDDLAEPQFHILVLSSLYGACVLVSSESFLVLFLGLELMSLPVYALVLLAYRRPESAEAALKYLVLGGTASATLLMGASLLYGDAGTLDLATFRDALNSTGAIAKMAVALVIAAFFLKAAVVPFHAWAPDAYEAAAVPVTAYMAAIIKAGVLLAAVRLFGTASMSRFAVELLAWLPLASIIWGNLAAMRQQSLRRMIAYSSIAHAGYLFYAFLGEAPGRFEAVAFYVLAYGVMNVLAFAALPRGDDDTARDRLQYLSGLAHRKPFAAVMIGIAMLSLAGVPPFPGFVAKFLIFKNVIAAGYTMYAVLGLIGSYIGLYFYLRVVQHLFMKEEEGMIAPVSASRYALGATLICLVVAVLVGVFPGWVIGQL